MALKKCVILGLVLLITEMGLSQDLRGFWLTDVASKALDSPEGIKKVVGDCKAAGFSQIYVVVWNRGYTLYPSELMQNTFGKMVSPRFKDRDILKELINEAHKEQIEVHAWFEFGFSSSYQEEDGGHIIRAKPHWAALDNQGNLVEKNGFQWMNAFLPEVQDFLISMILEVIRNYEVDGIQGDDRLPANPSTAGYDPHTLKLYRAENNGADPPQDYKDPDWVNWRANKLNDFAKRIYTEVKTSDPKMIVSMAPSIFPWSKEEYLQDWPTWLENDWVDYVIPQVYRYNLKAYKKTLDANLEFISEEDRSRFIPGILLKVDQYAPSRNFLKKMIRTNRKRGLQDEVFFFYEGLKVHKDFFNNLYKRL
ncbi:glycoside hydrolase family 10 protein [Poritiphilus flavus]|uniref:Family 10 glycosylhydrolase n=1 Tax=Poritiphilus flavus TaxID=2697053 RepID=A0A6L9EA41_9FLAO|nr:family 10 glycosylhydrolase [Poritiphilus flavus]NAS11534.1 family 10 glycosylhydrolase [Poritiphilus flavus]